MISSDKDQDGNFQWVDKTHVEFSNWRENFPQNTANMWDCGQIYTGEESSLTLTNNNTTTNTKEKNK